MPQTLKVEALDGVIGLKVITTAGSQETSFTAIPDNVLIRAFDVDDFMYRLTDLGTF